MRQQHRASPRKSAKFSKPLYVVALCCLVVLAIFIKKLVFHHSRKNTYATQTIKLPKLTETAAINEKKENKNSGWTIVETRPGDSLAVIFKRVGLSHQTLQTILYKNPHAKILAKIKPKQQIHFLIQEKILDKMIMPLSATEDLIITRNSTHYDSVVKLRKMNEQNNFLTATVQGSLYNTAKQANIPYKLIHQMSEIFNWEINFGKEIQRGDQFSIVYQAYYIDDKLVSVGDIIAVTYSHAGTVHKAIRHMDASGDYDYFSPEGLSLKKGFLRYPVKFSHISSTFSLSRYHPILHYRRPHHGIDLAAPIGTPVHATGDGQISIIDRHNGYGNMIKITHDNRYSSVYAHLLKFQKGLYRGARVKRGQVIGYVGQTGLADGPHCHYEFHVNHNPKNPATVDLPRASPVAAREMGSFRQKANTLLAQLKLFEDAHLAAAGKKTVG